MLRISQARCDAANTARPGFATVVLRRDAAQLHHQSLWGKTIIFLVSVGNSLREDAARLRGIIAAQLPTVTIG